MDHQPAVASPFPHLPSGNRHRRAPTDFEGVIEVFPALISGTKPLSEIVPLWAITPPSCIPP